MLAKVLIALLLTVILTVTLILVEVKFTIGGWVLLSLWEFLTIELTIIVFDQIRPGRAPRVPPPEEYGQFVTAIMNAKHYFAATSSKPVELWEQPTFLRHVDLNTLKTVSEYSRRLGLPASVISSDPIDKQELKIELDDILNRVQEGKPVPYFYGIRYLIYPEKTYEKRRPFVNALLQKHLTYRMHCLPITLERLEDRMGDRRSDFEELADHFRSPGRLRRAWYEIFGRPFRVPDFVLIDDTLLIRFEGKKFRDEDDPRTITLAKRVLTDLGKYATGTIWGGFDYMQISHLAKVAPTAATGFFSHDYFGHWLEYLERTQGPLHDWLTWENEKLKEYVKPGDVLLDVGCGYGRHLEMLLPRCGRAVGVDNSSHMVNRACAMLSNSCYQGKWQVLPFDAANLYFPDNTFSVVICMTNTFGNMNADKQSVREMARVLRQGGNLLVSVYSDSVDTLETRSETYTAPDVGLLITEVKDNRVIHTREGLVSEQFAKDEFRKLFRGTGLTLTKFEDFQDIGFMAVYTKKVESSLEF